MAKVGSEAGKKNGKKGERVYLGIPAVGPDWRVHVARQQEATARCLYRRRRDFAHGMRRLQLAELLAKHPDVRLSPMEDIRYWIEASTKGKSRPRQT
jgi:hypothetical protein